MSEPIVPKLHTPVHLVYTATVGRHYETYLRALSEGRIVGGVCSATGRVYVPPAARAR